MDHRTPHVFRLLFAALLSAAALPARQVVLEDVTEAVQDEATAKKKKVPVARFRLVDEDNKPLAKTNVKVDISARNDNSSSSSGMRKSTDAQGFVELNVDSSYEGYKELRIKIATGQGSGAGEGGFLGLFAKPWRGAMRTIELGKLQPGKNQLSDLQLRKDGYTVVASGRLTHDGGLAVAGAHFKLTLTYPTKWGHNTETIGTVQSVSGKRGKFEIRAFDDIGEGKLTLDVDKPGYVLEKPIEIERGQKDLRMMAYRAATVSGTLGPGQRELLSSLEFHLVTTKDGKESRQRVYQTTSGDKFSLKNLMPGEYALEVNLWQRPDNRVLTIPKLYLNGGKVNAPEELQGFDLDKLKEAKIVEVTVLLPDGKPAKGISVSDIVERGNGWSGRGRFPDANGKVRFLVPKEGGVIRIKTPKHKEVFMRNIDKDVVIKLEKK